MARSGRNRNGPKLVVKASKKKKSILYSVHCFLVKEVMLVIGRAFEKKINFNQYEQQSTFY